MRITPSARNREASFDLTPMIDVVLLLIIFFSMTSQFSETQNQPVDLPRERGQAASADAATMSIVVDMDRDGALRVTGKDYTQAELAEMLLRQARASALATSPLEIVVRADRRCASSHLDRLARSLAEAGILQWKLATTGAGGSET